MINNNYQELFEVMQFIIVDLTDISSTILVFNIIITVISCLYKINTIRSGSVRNRLECFKYIVNIYT